MEFYKNMTRRELQALCKQHGLPANLTNSRMAENLASLLEKRNCEDVKLRGCLKGSGGSSGEGPGIGRGVPKKVSFNLQEEDDEQDGSRRDLDARASPERRRSSRRRSVGNCALEEATEAASETNGDSGVMTRSKNFQSMAAAGVWSPIAEKKKARNRNNETNLAAKLSRQDDINRKKVDKEPDDGAQITRSLRNRVVTVAGIEALQYDAKPRRMQTRRNSKKKEEEDVTPVSDVSLGAGELGKDETFGNKASSKRTRSGVSTVEITDRHESLAPLFEQPPVRRSKRNLAKSCNLLLGREGSGPTAVVSVPDVKKLGKSTEEETEEAGKLQRPSKRSRRQASLVMEADFDISFPVGLGSKDEYPKKEPREREKKSTRNANLVLSLPDVLVTETAADDVRAGKLLGAKQPRRRSRRLTSVLNVLEHESSLSTCKSGHDGKTVRKNKTRKLERNKKKRKVAIEDSAPSCKTGDASQELTIQEVPERMARTKIVLRRSMRNVSRFASNKLEILAPLVKSSVINEAIKENMLPRHNGAELKIVGNMVVDVAAKVKGSRRLQRDKVLDEPLMQDCTANCTVGAENELLDGDKPQRKSVEKIRLKKRKRAAVLEDDFSIEKVQIAGRLDSDEVQQENVSSIEHKECLHEKSCEKIPENNMVLGMFSPKLAVILTEAMPNCDAYDNPTKIVGSSKMQSSQMPEKCSDLYIEEGRKSPSKVVEPVAFDLFDTHKATDCINGSQDSAHPANSVDLSVNSEDVVLETGGSNHSNKLQNSPSIDSLMSEQNHTDQLAAYVKFSQVNALHGNLGGGRTDSTLNHMCLDFTEMANEEKEDRENLGPNLVEVSSGSKGGCSYVEAAVAADNAVAGVACSAFKHMTNVSSTLASANYLEERDRECKHTNVVDAPVPCSYPEEHSPAVATEVSSMSDCQTAVTLANFHGVGEIGCHTPICPPDVKNEVILSSTVEPDNGLVDLLEQQILKNDFHSSNMGQGDEILVSDEGNENSSSDAAGSISCNNASNFNFSEQLVESRELSSLKLMDISSDIKDSPLEVKDGSRSSLRGNLYQNHENVISPHVDSVKPKEQMKASELKSSCEEYTCSDVVNVLSGISVSSSEIPGHTVKVESAVDEDVTLSPAGLEFEKQPEVQAVFQVMHVKSSDSSIISSKHLSVVDALPHVDYSEKNHRMKRVGTPSSTGGILVLKDQEIESANQEDADDARALCDEISDRSPVHQIKSLGTGEMNSSSMCKKSNNEKTSGVSSSKIWNTHLDGDVNVLPDNKENHLSNVFSPASKNSSGGKSDGYRSNDLKVPQNEGETLVNSATMKNPNSVSEEFKVIDKLEEIPTEDRQLQLLGSPLCVFVPDARSFGEDEFQEDKKAHSCETTSRDEEDASGSKSLPLSILRESNIVNDYDLSISSKRENLAAIKQIDLVFQTPSSNKLPEFKDVDVGHNVVMNGGLDASYGISSRGHELVKSLCKENTASINKFDEELVHILEEPLNLGTHGLCGEIEVSSDVCESSAGTLDGKGSTVLERMISSGTIVSSVKDVSSSHTHSHEIICLADQHEDIRCVAPGIEDSANNYDHCTTNGNLAFRHLVIAETKLVEADDDLESRKPTISEVPQEASEHNLDSSQPPIIEMPQEAAGIVGLVGELVIPRDPENEDSKTDARNYDGFTELDRENDEFGPKDYNINSDESLEAKNDGAALHEELDGTDPSEVNQDLGCYEEAEMEICDSNKGSYLSHYVHKHDEGKDNISASTSSDDCLCELGSFEKASVVNQESISDEVWVAPGASLMSIEDLFAVEVKESLVMNDIAQAVVTEHISAEENLQHEYDNSAGRSGASKMEEKLENVSFMSEGKVVKEWEEVEHVTFTTICDDITVNLVGAIESENAAQLEVSSDCPDTKSADGMQHPASMIFREERSLEGTGAVEDEGEALCFPFGMNSGWSEALVQEEDVDDVDKSDVEVVNTSEAAVQEKHSPGSIDAFVQEEDLVDVEKTHVESFNDMNDSLQQTQASTGFCASTNDDDASEPLETIESTRQDWMEEISRKLYDFRISSAKRNTKSGIEETPLRLKHDVANGMPMGKENTPAGRKEYSYKRTPYGSAVKSTRRPLQSIKHS